MTAPSHDGHRTVVCALHHDGVLTPDSLPRVPIVVDEFQPARRSLRIAVVTETYPPEVNGVAMTIACFVRGLIAREHTVQLVRPRQGNTGAATDKQPGNALQEVLMRGLPIPNYPNLRLGLPAKNALVKLWSLQRPDVVHIVTEGPLGWSALQAARRLKLPVTSDFRTNFHAYSRHYGIGWLHKPIFAYLRKFHNRTQCTMVPTEALRRDLAGYGFHNLAVVARGVDTAQFDPAKRSDALRENWGAGADTLVVLCVGRLAPEKNLNVVIAAFKAMRNVRPDAKLVFVGDGPSRVELQQRCPDAVFAGQRTGVELATFYASADAFLFPSITETFGNVTPEAMASGLPVVAYDYASAAQLIRHGESGWLAPFDNAGEFVRLAAELAADVGKAREVGRTARLVTLEHDWDRVVGRLENVLVRAIHGQGLLRAPAGMSSAGGTVGA